MFRFASANMNTADCASASYAEAACACTVDTAIAIRLDAIILASILIIGVIGLRHLAIVLGVLPTFGLA